MVNEKKVEIYNNQQKLASALSERILEENRQRPFKYKTDGSFFLETKNRVNDIIKEVTGELNLPVRSCFCYAKEFCGRNRVTLHCRLHYTDENLSTEYFGGETVILDGDKEYPLKKRIITVNQMKTLREIAHKRKLAMERARAEYNEIFYKVPYNFRGDL